MEIVDWYLSNIAIRLLAETFKEEEEDKEEGDMGEDREGEVGGEATVWVTSTTILSKNLSRR